MILTLVFSIVGVSIMFYRFGVFTPQAGLHPIIGLLCVALCICQPINALFRCHPGTKKRPFFNWAHWFIGNTAQILGGKSSRDRPGRQSLCQFPLKSLGRLFRTL